MVKLNRLRERWFFIAEFDQNGALKSVTAAGRHDGVMRTWTAFPADFYVVVAHASPNADHLVRYRPYERASFRLDGPGFITGVCVRDLG